MKTPKALTTSVIIPAYNSEKTIGECLKSLKKQTEKPGEIIVVDDGSRDRTTQTTGKSGVRIIKQEHAGPAAARNRGVRAARGEIILFTDADCIPDRDWVKEMLASFQDSKIAGVQGSYKTRQKALLARFAQFEIEQRYKRLSGRKYIDFMGTYSAAYRRDLFLKFRGFDEGFPEASGEDPELSFRLFEAGHKMVFNPMAMVFHQHPDTLRKYLKQKFGRAKWRVLLYRKHPNKMVSESYTPQNLKLQIGLFCMFVIFLLMSPFLFVSFYVSMSLLILLFLSTLPFSIKAGRGDRRLGTFSPFILILRSAAFSLGLLYGVLNLVLLHKR